MAFDLELPDGTVLTDIPDGTTKADIIKKLGYDPGQPAYSIPGNSGPTRSGRQPPGIIDRAIGAGEALLSTVTGATGGAVGQVGGFLGGLAGAVRTGEFGTDEGARRVERVSTNAASGLTYAPRTTEGQRQTAAVGNAIAQTVPLAPMAAEIGAVVGNAARARPAVQAAATQRAVATAERVAPRAVERVRRAQEAAASEPSPLNPNVRVSLEQAAKERAQKYAADRLGTRLADLPAAIRQQLEAVARDATALEGLDAAAIKRQALLEGLPVRVPASRGQVTRDLQQLTLEEGITKAEAGAPLRDINAQADTALYQNIDTLRGKGRSTTRQGLGNSVQGTLRDKLKEVSANRRNLFERAEEAGAMADPVDLTLVDEWLTDPIRARNTPGLASALKDYRAASRDGRITFNQAERVLEELTQASKEPTTQGHYAGQAARVLEDVMDAAAESLPEGNPYRAARAAYRAEKSEFDRQGRIKALVTEKGMTTDRAVALEDTLDHVLRGSAEDIKRLRRSLISGGTPQTRRNGAQAWRDLRVAVLDHLKEKAGGKRQILGEQDQQQFNSSFIDAFNELDADGKLGALFSAKELTTLRQIRDAVGIVRTKPTGRIHNSATASNAVALIERFAHRLPVGSDLVRGAIKGVKELREKGAEARRVEAATRSPLQEAASAPPPPPRRPTLRDYFNASPPP